MQAQFAGIGEDTADTESRIGIAVMLLMITVIGGRIIPTFTTNALRAAARQELIDPRAWCDFPERLFCDHAPRD